MLYCDCVKVVATARGDALVVDVRLGKYSTSVSWDVGG